MAFSGQIPGSMDFVQCPFTDHPSGGTLWQKSCYSYVEKISGLINPTSFQQDVIYPNALAAITSQVEAGLNSGGQQEVPRLVGCKGHQIDNEFPLESRTPSALPLLMYPSPTNGKCLHEVDMCGKPVLNWEAYIQDIKASLRRTPQVSGASKSWEGNASNFLAASSSEIEPLPNDNLGTRNQVEGTVEGIPSSSITDITDGLQAETAGEGQEVEIQATSKKKAIVNRNQITDFLMQQGKRRLPAGLSGGEGKLGGRHTVQLDESETWEHKLPSQRDNDKLPLQSLRRLKNQPKLQVKGTWNHLYGGLGGACSFMNTGFVNRSSTHLTLFVGKGSRLRAVNIREAKSSSILSYTTDSVWEEDGSVPSSTANASNRDPLHSLIFQIVPSEKQDILGVRRGKRIDIFSTEDDAPYLLESIPNVMYGGTDDYYRKRKSVVGIIEDPLLLGLDCNRNLDILTIDENWVVRFCDISKQITESCYALPKPSIKQNLPPAYPSFKINDAAGASFANSSKLFYAWGNGIVHFGDRRDISISRNHLSPIFDLQKSQHSHALSDQNYFHDKPISLNEYISCVKKSEREEYYYVGTTSKIYLMDLRVPTHPVIVLSHGLQSPLAYLGISSDDNYEVLVGGSQRLNETVCVITDTAHVQCIDRPGCASRNPVLHCYPRHLSNSRDFFDAVTKQGYEFPMPVDHDNIKNHHYAWSTGLAVWPTISKGNVKQPPGVMVATTNNFGDIFLQEWEQRPVPPHRKVDFEDHKVRGFLGEWRNSMLTKVLVTDKPAPSKNKWKGADCSLIVEPISREIEKLSRIRDSPFDCFVPDELVFQRNLDNMIPLENLISKLSVYKGERVKTVLDVWMKSSSQTTESPAAEEVVIKEEPHSFEFEGLGSSPHSFLTIDIDVSEHEQGGVSLASRVPAPERSVQVVDINSPESRSSQIEAEHRSNQEAAVSQTQVGTPAEAVDNDTRISAQQDDDDDSEYYSAVQSPMSTQEPNLHDMQQTSPQYSEELLYMQASQAADPEVLGQDQGLFHEDELMETNSAFQHHSQSSAAYDDSQQYGELLHSQDFDEDFPATASSSQRPVSSSSWRKSNKRKRSGFL